MQKEEPAREALRAEEHRILNRNCFPCTLSGFGAVHPGFDRASAAVDGIAAGLEAGPAMFDALDAASDAGSAALERIGAGFYRSDVAFDAGSAGIDAGRGLIFAGRLAFDARSEAFNAWRARRAKARVISTSGLHGLQAATCRPRRRLGAES
jgi:hypothetical protein